MNIAEVKTNLNNLPLIDTLPVDEQLAKYINLAQLLFDIFYVIDDEFKQSENYTTAISIQIAYLIQNTPFENVDKQYNYLSSFSVAGAISGTVKEKLVVYISPVVNTFLEKYRLC